MSAVEDAKQQLSNQPVNSLDKPATTVKDALRKLCDVKLEEYMLAVKAYIDHDFELYKNGRVTTPGELYMEKYFQ